MWIMVATDLDRKAADKNIFIQLKRAQDMKGKTDVEFLDKKKQKVDIKIINKALDMFDKMKPNDKLKMQLAIGKSYRDLLKARTTRKSIMKYLDTKKGSLEEAVSQAMSGYVAKELVDEGGKYLKYSDLLLQKGRLLAKKQSTAMIDKEISKEMKKLGISRK